MKATAPFIIYKTRGDYSQQVLVRLSEDGKRIISFPAPSDLRVGKEFLLPIPLNQGYWLDRQGVDAKTVFLNMSYKAYSQLPSPPEQAQLLAMIEDRSPITEMYYCGRAADFKDVEKELKEVIQQKGLDRFKRLL
ncbi:MAG: hypothetical protein ACLFT3_03235 [Cyclobacteriaceae bacterium]